MIMIPSTSYWLFNVALKCVPRTSGIICISITFEDKICNWNWREKSVNIKKFTELKPVGHETHLFFFTLASQNQMLIKTRTLYEVIWECSYIYVSDQKFNF
jgi:hypothetical protein